MIRWQVNPHGIRTLQYFDVSEIVIGQENKGTWVDTPVVDVMWDVKAEIEEYAKDLVTCYGGNFDALKDAEKDQWRNDARKLLAMGYYKKRTQ